MRLSTPYRVYAHTGTLGFARLVYGLQNHSDGLELTHYTHYITYKVGGLHTKSLFEDIRITIRLL